MKRMTTITLILGMLALSLAAAARIPFDNPRVAEELGLTADQQQRLETLHFQHRRGQLELRHQKQMKTLQFEEEMAKETPDPSVLDRLIEEAGAIRILMKKAKVRHMLAVREILTPEQWEKARAFVMNRGGRRGPGGPGGPGMGDGRRMGPGPLGGGFPSPDPLPQEGEDGGF